MTVLNMPDPRPTASVHKLMTGNRGKKKRPDRHGVKCVPPVKPRLTAAQGRLLYRGPCQGPPLLPHAFALLRSG
jgi:hypothetical protein